MRRVLRRLIAVVLVVNEGANFLRLSNFFSDVHFYERESSFFDLPFFLEGVKF